MFASQYSNAALFMVTKIPILLYHSIAEQASRRWRHWTIHPEQFASQMANLDQLGYTPITVSQFVESMSDAGEALPERPIVLTFDDGFADFHSKALPVLQRFSFGATLYITTGYVGDSSRWLRAEGEADRPMLTWHQIDEIASANIECGAHSHRHKQLDLLPLSNAKDEIERSKAALEQRLGRRVASFAYPHGYYSDQIRQMVRDAGFSSACGVKHAISSLNDDRFALARIIVSGQTDIYQFSMLLIGRGVSSAPVRERMRTKTWRLVRRIRHQVDGFRQVNFQ